MGSINQTLRRSPKAAFGKARFRNAAQDKCVIKIAAAYGFSVLPADEPEPPRFITMNRFHKLPVTNRIQGIKENDIHE